MKNKSVCFISYEWNDIDEEFLFILKDMIEKDKDINVILDKTAFSLGDDIVENEQKITSSDVVIVFFSENYKKKIFEAKDTGVYREYLLIKELIGIKNKIILPVLYSGTMEVSVPEEFKYKLFCDLSTISPKTFTDKKSTSLNNALNSKMKNLINEIKSRLEIMLYTRDPIFKNLDEEYNALFINTNAAHIPRECIVETNAYRSIKNQSVYFILGRKGSGKTTLLETIRKYDSEYYLNTYKMTEPIDAEHLRLEFFYNKIVTEFKAYLSEIDLTKILKVFWELFIFLYCTYDVAVEFEKGRIKSTDSRYEIFQKTTRIIKAKLGRKGKSIDDSDCRRCIFNLASELIYNHLNSGIFDNANIETLITSVNTNFNATNILIKFFGKALYEKFCIAIKECEKKILIALDGFDPYSEDFRRTTNTYKEIDLAEYKLRKDYEILFYRELMILISNIKDSKEDKYLKDAFSIVDFCIIIPQDRYDEIKEYDRDSIKRKYCCLCWDAHDLLLMLIKRLEYYFKVSTGHIRSLRGRFNYLIERYLPNIPLEIMININGHEMPMHLFNYILRLSFWRPRDILTNFAVILKINKEVNETSEIVQGIIKKLLVQNVRETIEQEFLKEYKNVYINLDLVLQSFEKNNLIIDFISFYESLINIDFGQVFCNENNSSTDKLYMLYKMGVVGLFYEKNEAISKAYGFNICFIFNEGLQPLDDLMKGGKYLNTRTKIIFNPIFSKYLELNMNTNELIMNFSEDDITSNHIMSGNIRRI